MGENIRKEEDSVSRSKIENCNDVWRGILSESHLNWTHKQEIVPIKKREGKSA